ncbi:MAG: 16S rRNA (cytosine(1402)-N(4))-methyltransferase RsmH [Pirellulaceae bacterium]
MTTTTVHVPVLPAEILELGQPSANETWVDGTAGGGGHCLLLRQHLGTTGRLLAIDRDPAATQRLAALLGGPQTVVRHGSYDATAELLRELQWPAPAGILLDLGLSSDQLADRQRGFSFQTDGELDMRFDTTSGEPAWEWLNRVDEKTLADTIYRFGEERFSRRIAKRVVDTRKSQPIRTASQLRELITRSVPAGRPTQHGRRHGRVDPATRTFQALRIAVNDELSILERALQRLPDCLAAGGKLLIISFHSLEDRLVKYAFRGDERLHIVTRRPVQASDEEVARNPRARSAKLRVAMRK